MGHLGRCKSRILACRQLVGKSSSYFGLLPIRAKSSHRKYTYNQSGLPGLGRRTGLHQYSHCHNGPCNSSQVKVFHCHITNPTYNCAHAIHDSAKKASKWRTLDTDNILTVNPVVYDASSPSDRKAIDDLEAFDLHDEDGMEIPIYAPNGSRIPRRAPLFAVGRKPCGLLVSLARICDLFVEWNADNEDYCSDFEDPPPNMANIYLYPQAYLKKHGHVQADTVPVPLQRIIKTINNKVAEPIMNDQPPTDDDSNNDSDEDDDRNITQGPVPTGFFLLGLVGTSCQLYNAIMHRVRPMAGKHDAQLGTVTNAFAGSYADSPSQKRTAAQKLKSCTQQLPQERFQQRMDHDDLHTDLRMEFVIKINIAALRTGCKHGRYDLRILLSWQCVILLTYMAARSTKIL